MATSFKKREYKASSFGNGPDAMYIAYRATVAPTSKFGRTVSKLLVNYNRRINDLVVSVDGGSMSVTNCKNFLKMTYEEAIITVKLSEIFDNIDFQAIRKILKIKYRKALAVCDFCDRSNNEHINQTTINQEERAKSLENIKFLEGFGLI